MINERMLRKICKDDISKIENYELAKNDTTQTWDCHHRLELTIDGEFAHSRADLIRLDMYYHRPYFELIFLTPSDHLRLHNKGANNPMHGKINPMQGKHHSAEARRKISEANKGKNNSMYGKINPMYGKHHSTETRKKMSNSQKGTNNPMYGRQHSEETRNKMKAAWARRRQESEAK